MFRQEEKMAKEVRKDIIEMIYNSKSGHPGGSLSITEILVYLYNKEIKVHEDGSKDMFVLSKGHAAPALYSVLSHKGLIARDELKTLRQLGSKLQGHPDSKKIEAIDVSTGSLGQGISNSVGIALGNKISKCKARTFVILGDGELQEGLVWEAIMSAAHYKLNNLIAFVDYNGLQIDGKNEDVITLGSLEDKFKSFGANVISINGHSFNEISDAMKNLSSDKPNIIIAKTVKGKGVSFMEGQVGWHGTAPNEEQKNQAIKELL